MERAALSVMNNIAEGFARKSTKDRIQFFVIAIASLSETRSMIYVGEDIGIFLPQQSNELFQQCEKVHKTLSGFLKYLHSIKS